MCIYFVKATGRKETVRVAGLKQIMKHEKSCTNRRIVFTVHTAADQCDRT